MPLQYYHLAHLVGLICIFIGFGCLLNSENTKTAMKWHGTGLLISIITGFGMLAKLGLMKAFPVWAIIKLALWLVLGVLPVLAKRRVLSSKIVVIIAALVGATLAFLGYMKPVW